MGEIGQETMEGKRDSSLRPLLSHPWSHSSNEVCVVTASQSSTMSSVSQQSSRRAEDSAQTQRAAFGRQGSTTGSVTGEDTEDTMKNLRKTFAGIFGDM